MWNTKDIELLPDESIGNKLIKKWFWLYFFTILVAPTGYIIRVLVSNSLSVSEVGILYGVISFVSLLSVYNDLWLTESLSYFIPKYRIHKKYNQVKTIIFFSLWVQILTGIALALFLFFGADWLALHYFHNESVIQVLKYFSVYFLFINILQVLQSTFRAFQDMFMFKLSDFVKMGTTTLFTIIFFFGGFAQLSYFALAWVLGLILSVIVAITILLRKYKEVFRGKYLERDKKEMKRYTRYALAIFIWANASVLLGQVDMQMILYFLWGSSAGYYTNYLSLINISSLVLWPLLALLFPLISELINKRQLDKYQLLLSFFYKYFWVFALSLGALLFILWPQIALVLFGKNFLISWELLHYSALFLVFNVFVAINFNILAWLGKVKERVRILLIATVINIVLNWFLIRAIGLPWAIISTVFGWTLMFVLSFRVLNHFQKIRFDFKFLFKNLFFIILFVWGLYWIKEYILVFDNTTRIRNFLYLLIIWVGFYWYLAAVNYKSIGYLKREILALKKK